MKDSMRDEPYKIGELSKLSGLTTRTLRYYEELKLISSKRTSGGQRLYNNRALNRLHIIESLKTAGLTLREIRHILLDWKQSRAGSEAALRLSEILQAKHRKISQTLHILSALKEQLETSINLLDNCSSCSQKPEPDLCASCDAPKEDGKNNSLIDEIMKS